MSLSNYCCNCKGKIISSSLPEKYDYKHGVTDADFVNGIKGYSGIRPFRAWIQMVLPQVYDDALSYQELVYKLLHYVNTLISDVETCESNIDILTDAVKQLQCYVNNYFKNLDLTGEVEKLLDEMSLNGTLGSLLNEYWKVGSGLQYSETTEGETSTESVTESVENYPECCSCCSCCDSCPYYKLADGDTVVSTFTSEGVKVVTTISRDGDEITTIKETTYYVKKRVLYTDLAEGNGIKINPGSSATAGTQTISSLVKQGSGIIVELDDDNYYKISTLDSVSLSDSLTLGTDYSYEYKNQFYCVDDSTVSYANYDYVGGVTDWTKLEHYCDPSVNGIINKDGDGNVLGITVTIKSPTSWVHAGNIADSSLFQFKHTTPLTDCPECVLADFVFKGDYAALSNKANSVNISVPTAMVWNIRAVGGDPSVKITDGASLANFGASWNVVMNMTTYTGDDGLRHFVITANSIGDGYNTQYSRYGDYMYGFWLNTGTYSISCTL